MQHIYRRCKHCNKEYLYCTYGNGPDWGTEKYCSMDYCSECQKAINDALSKIPERYSYKMELIPKEDFDYINKTIDTQYLEYKKEISDNVFGLTQIVIENEYDAVEGCYINHIYYTRGIKKGGEIEIKQSMEYDLIDEKLTGKRYRFYDMPCMQYKPLSILKFPTAENLKVKPLDPPTGKNFFDFPEWEVITNDENENDGTGKCNCEDGKNN